MCHVSNAAVQSITVTFFKQSESPLAPLSGYKALGYVDNLHHLLESKWEYLSNWKTSAMILSNSMKVLDFGLINLVDIVV